MYPVVKTYVIKNDKIKFSNRSFSLLLLSDFHGDTDVGHIYSILKTAEELKPDIIFSSGDMILSKTDSSIKEVIGLFRDLSYVAPVYAVDGNHEMKINKSSLEYGTKYKVYNEMLKGVGVNVLADERCDITLKDNNISVYGYDLPYEKYRKFRIHTLGVNDITDKLGSPDEKNFNILLTHNPAFAKTYFSWGADLTLAGHYHGGLVRVGDIPLLSPYGFIFPRYGYGRRSKGNRSIVVSGGLGNHSIPVRIGNPREMVHVLVEGAEVSDGDTC